MTEKEIEQLVAFFALRYSLGRKTYAFGVVSDYILAHMQEWPAWRLQQAAEEIEEVSYNHVDLPKWERTGYRSVAKKFRAQAERGKEDVAE